MENHERGELPSEQKEFGITVPSGKRLSAWRVFWWLQFHPILSRGKMSWKNLRNPEIFYSTFAARALQHHQPFRYAQSSYSITSVTKSQRSYALQVRSITRRRQSWWRLSWQNMSYEVGFPVGSALKFSFYYSSRNGSCSKTWALTSHHNTKDFGVLPIHGSGSRIHLIPVIEPVGQLLEWEFRCPNAREYLRRRLDIETTQISKFTKNKVYEMVVVCGTGGKTD